MSDYKLYFLMFSLYFSVATARSTVHAHKRNGLNHHMINFHSTQNVDAQKSVQGHKRNDGVNPFQSTQSIDDLVKNPTALNNDEASEINKLDHMSEVFMNPEVSSESQDLSRQGLDPDVAMQISKLDHNFQDIFGSNRANRRPSTNARQKGDILPGYGEQYNPDGSVSLSNNEWPEYQMKDTPPMASLNKPSPENMLPGNSDNSQQALVSPQAALNPNLLPGQKSDLGMGMGVAAGGNPSSLGPDGPMMSRFVNDAEGNPTPNKGLMNPPFKKPGIKSAGFRIPGEFSFKGERKSDRVNEDANFVKNFMSAKKSHTARKKTGRNGEN